MWVHGCGRVTNENSAGDTRFFFYSHFTLHNIINFRPFSLIYRKRGERKRKREKEGGREGGSGCVGVEREKERGVERREIRDEEIIKERRRCDDKRSTQARKAMIVSLAASE